MKSALLALLLASLSLAPARAQLTAKPAAPAVPILTQAQAQGVLDILQNDARRAQFIAVLQNMAKVQAAAPKAAGIPLNAGSIGAEVLSATSGAIGRLSTAGFATVRALADVPQLSAWASRTLQDPGTSARLISAAWTSIALAAAAGGARFLAFLALSRWRAKVERTGPPEDQTPSTTEPPRPSSWSLLRRLPTVLLRLLIDLLPVAAFATIAYGALVTPLGADPGNRVLLLGLVNAAIALQLAMAVLRMMLSPTATNLRLVHMSDAAARYLILWSAGFLALAILGYQLVESARLFGMPLPIHDALLRMVALFLHILAIVLVLHFRAGVARRLRAPSRASGAWKLARDRFADIWHVVAIFYLAAFWLISAFEIRNGYAVVWRTFLILAAAFGLARLASIILLGGLDRILHLQPETLARYPGLDRSAGRYHALLRLLIKTGVLAIAAVILLHLWGVPVTAWLKAGSLTSRILHALTSSALIVLVALVVWEALNVAIQGHLARLATGGDHDRSARLRTLLPMLRTTLMVVILVFTGLMVMAQIGVNTAPLLAGAGVIGIAIGFGSQKLVQDVITGLFLLLENAVQVGDWVSLANLTGTVETLSIRSIQLRALDGAVHLIPFSAVTTITNSTRDYGYAVLDVTAGYNEEPDHIATILRGVAEEMRADERWGDALAGDIDIQGVDKFLDNAWVLRARMKTSPSQRLPVQREFNRRLKYRFDHLAIESPFTSPRILSTNPPPPPQLTAADQPPAPEPPALSDAPTITSPQAAPLHAAPQEKPR